MATTTVRGPIAPPDNVAYAQVIERLMQAKAVAIDVLFTPPSIYHEADDQLLQ
jgi:CHASE2 domain-containing sensor protein